jgi:hypothetical protein
MCSDYCSSSAQSLRPASSRPAPQRSPAAAG